MDRQLDSQSGGNPISQRVAALSYLLGSLAWLFSYPDKEQASVVTSSEFLIQCKRVLHEAELKEVAFEELFSRCEFESQFEESQRARIVRIEYTRLFITPPRLIRMEGSYWVQNRTLLSRKKGEKFAVGQVYGQLGLTSRSGSSDPSDHIVSELDFASYVAAAEARAWEGGDAVNAREWKCVRDDFVRDHLGELALGVASEVQRLSKNVFMLFYADLLRVAVSSRA